MLHEAPSIFIKEFEIPAPIVTMWIIMIALALIFALLSSGLKVKNIGKRQVIAELIVSSLLGLFSSIMGQERLARRYLALLASFFLLIIISNFSGIIPGAGIIPGFAAPTSNLSVTAGLALVSFIAVIYYGIRAKGLNYFKHFVQPFWPMLPLNLLEELVKPVSLAIRLYGSVFADEVVLATVFNLVPAIAPIPFYFVSLFFGALQALVFTLLSAIYLSIAIEESED